MLGPDYNARSALPRGALWLTAVRNRTTALSKPRPVRARSASTDAALRRRGAGTIREKAQASRSALRGAWRFGRESDAGVRKNCPSRRNELEWLGLGPDSARSVLPLGWLCVLVASGSRQRTCV